MDRKDKKIHDLCLIYALVNYMEARSQKPDMFNKEREKYGIAFETDFIHSLYMEAFREYSNYDDDSFDLTEYFGE